MNWASYTDISNPHDRRARSRRRLFGIAVIACTFGALLEMSSDRRAAAADTTRLAVSKGLTIQVGSLTRTYDLATPPTVAALVTPTTAKKASKTKSNNKKPKKTTPEKTTIANVALRPLVLVFHGNGGSADQALDQTDEYGSPLGQWLAIGARENLVVAAPNGSL